MARIPALFFALRGRFAFLLLTVAMAPLILHGQGPTQYIARVVPMEPDHSPKLLFSAVNDRLGDAEMTHDVDHGLFVVRTHQPFSAGDMAALMDGTGYLLLHFQGDPRDPWDVVKSGAQAPVPVHTDTGEAEADRQRYAAEIAAWVAAHPY